MMKKHRILFFLVIFILVIGSFLVYIAETSKSLAFGFKPFSNSSEDKQTKTLLIVCNRLSTPKPELLGVWLVIYVHKQDGLIFLPLFPAVVKNADVKDPILQGSFSLNSDGLPSTKFFDYIRNMNIEWDHFLVIDEDLFTLLTDLSGGINVDGKLVYGNEISSFLNQTTGNNSKSLEYQRIIINEICSRIPLILSHPNAKLVSNYILTKSITSYSVVDIHSGWKQLIMAQINPICEFPSIKTSLSTSGH